MKIVSFLFLVNKHKPWIETSYHGVITENNDTVILDPPLVALDKDAPVPYAGRKYFVQCHHKLCVKLIKWIYTICMQYTHHTNAMLQCSFAEPSSLKPGPIELEMKRVYDCCAFTIKTK